MKSLTNYLTESRVDESVLGVAAGILVGYLGIKLIKGLAKTLTDSGVKHSSEKIIDSQTKVLEEVYIPKLDELLQSHPKSLEYLSKYWNQTKAKDLFALVNRTIGQLTFADDVIKCDDWSDEDANEFRDTWEKAFAISKKLQKMESDALESILGMD